MKCKHCNSENPENAKHCNQCGKNLSEGDDKETRIYNMMKKAGKEAIAEYEIEKKKKEEEERKAKGGKSDDVLDI